MQVLFRSRKPQAHELRAGAQRLPRFAVRRLGWRMPKATLKLSGLQSPRGRPDKRCRVVIEGDVAGTLVLASLAGDWRTTRDNAVARSGRCDVRQRRRRNGNHRLRQRVIPLTAATSGPDKSFSRRRP